MFIYIYIYTYHVLHNKTDDNMWLNNSSTTKKHLNTILIDPRNSLLRFRSQRTPAKSTSRAAQGPVTSGVSDLQYGFQEARCHEDEDQRPGERTKCTWL